jgi:hypothetical protein
MFVSIDDVEIYDIDLKIYNLLLSSLVRVYL